MRALILLLVLMVVLIGCTTVRPGVDKEPRLEEEVIEEEVEAEEEVIEEEVEEPEPTCEEWAESLFPAQWVFNQDVSHDPKLTKEIIGLREGKWRDNSSIKRTSSTKIELGSGPGENRNYYYTRPIFPGMKEENYGFVYLEGSLGVTNTFHIRPVFRVIRDTVKDERNERDDLIKVRYLSLRVQEPGFISCERGD